MGKLVSKQYEVQQRRAHVGELLVSGRQEWQTAEHLGVSLRTVERDVAALRAEWQTGQRQAADQHRGEHLARLDGLIAAFYPTAVERKSDHAATIVWRALDSRAKLLGYGEPQKLALNWQRIEELSAEFGVPVSEVADLVQRTEARLLGPGGSFATISEQPEEAVEVIEGEVVRET